MNVLFVMDSIPIPATNGVNLPIVKLCSYLCKKHHVDAVVVTNNKEFEEDRKFELAKIGVKKISIFSRRRKNRFVRIFNELSFRKSSFENFVYNDLELKNDEFIQKYDWVWVSPISCFDFCDYVLNKRYVKVDFVGLGLNDVISHAYYDSLNQFKKRGTLEFTLFFKFLRSFIIKVHEKRIYSAVDLIHLQTNKEARRANLLLGLDQKIINNKICVAPNGKSENLADTPYESSHSKNIVFFTNFKGPRRFEAHWFFKNVWNLIKRDTEFNLLLVGSPPNQDSLHYKDKRIKILGYVDNLEDVYRQAAIVVLPIFHQAGLVNRLQDALTAGIPVVCTSYPASTIPMAQDNVHLMIADDPVLFASKVVTLSKQSGLRHELSTAAKKLSKSFLSWQEFGSCIEDQMLGTMIESGKS